MDKVQTNPDVIGLVCCMTPSHPTLQSYHIVVPEVPGLALLCCVSENTKPFFLKK